MKILITIHQFFPEYRAGTEVLTLSVAKELMVRGHDIRVFTGHPGDDDLNDHERFDEYEYEGIPIYRFHHSYVPMFNQISMVEVSYNNKLSVHYFSKVYDSFQPELVHHFHLSRLGVGIINYLYDKDIPQYFTPTDFWMICQKAQLILYNGSRCNGPDKLSGNCLKHFIQFSANKLLASLLQKIPDIFFQKIIRLAKKYKYIDRSMNFEGMATYLRLSRTIDALNKMQGIISPNHFMSNFLIRYGVRASILHEKRFGIYFNREVIGEKYKNWRKGKSIRIVFIGTLSPHKGCEIAIKAINLLPNKFATLTIFGSGKEFPKYVKKLHTLAKGKKNIFFEKEFCNENIFSVFNAFDVLVVPSVWFENTPLVIYSAQAAFCPVIGSDIPGISEVISHNVNGLLFEPGNYKDLSKKIKYFRELDLKEFSKRSLKPKKITHYVDDICNIWSLNTDR